jgi:NAD(P)-dependent dehydrogenase (short-subunit alcohol dehydrogenase family)
LSSSLFDLTGQTAVVVGGTSGIGLALALGLADAGANVVATGRRADLVEAAACQIQSRGRRSLAMATDVTQPGSLEAFRDAVLKEFGSVEILLNCAGIIKRTPTLDVSMDEWNQIMEINVNGTLRGCQVFGKHMVERKYGRIINIASLSSFVGLNEVAAYGASKSAVKSLTQTLAIELAKHGVCVNAIVPGLFRTDLNAALLDGTPRGQEFKIRTPMGRFGRTEELVGAALYLASKAASFTTGQTIAVDGGFLSSGVNQ